MMSARSIALVFLSLLPLPAAAQSVATVTLIEGSLRLIRGTTVFQAAEGLALKQGDILENSESGFTQLEFEGGAVVALGPSSRIYIFRHSAGGKGGSASGADLVLLRGWLKGESNAGAGTFRYDCPILSATTGNGTVVFHSSEGGCDVFVESGPAAIGEVSRGGNLGQATAAKTRQFYSRLPGKSVSSLSRPTSVFLDAMPLQFRDTLPPRLARFAGKRAEPKAQHQVSYGEIQAWLTMPLAWRKGFVERFESRLKDPEFRKQVEMHVAEHPEWDPILHPEEKDSTKSPPSAVRSSESFEPGV